MPRGAGRGVDGESAETSAKTGRGLRPEIAEAGPAVFGPMDGERLGAQVAALADELGLDLQEVSTRQGAFSWEAEMEMRPRAEKFGDQVGERRAWRVECRGICFRRPRTGLTRQRERRLFRPRTQHSWRYYKKH